MTSKLIYILFVFILLFAQLDAFAAGNTKKGTGALANNTSGNYNSAFGNFTLWKNTTGDYNTASGAYALNSNTEGYSNTASGVEALYSNTIGSRNTALGDAAGLYNEGSGNVFLGYNAGLNEKQNNKLYISNNEKRPLLYGRMSKYRSKNKLGIGTASVPADDAIMVWNGAHLTKAGVWTNASSRDLKDNIQTLNPDDANAALAALEPMRYVYRNSPDEEYVGFIAEDVPDLVATNDRKSLAAMDIVAVLTTVVKEQQARLGEIATLRSENAQLVARLDALSRRMDLLVQESPVATAY